MHIQLLVAFGPPPDPDQPHLFQARTCSAAGSASQRGGRSCCTGTGTREHGGGHAPRPDHPSSAEAAAAHFGDHKRTLEDTSASNDAQQRWPNTGQQTPVRHLWRSSCPAAPPPRSPGAGLAVRGRRGRAGGAAAGAGHEALRQASHLAAAPAAPPAGERGSQPGGGEGAALGVGGGGGGARGRR